MDKIDSDSLNLIYDFSMQKVSLYRYIPEKV